MVFPGIVAHPYFLAVPLRFSMSMIVFFVQQISLVWQDFIFLLMCVVETMDWIGCYFNKSCIRYLDNHMYRLRVCWKCIVCRKKIYIHFPSWEASFFIFGLFGIHEKEGGDIRLCIEIAFHWGTSLHSIKSWRWIWLWGKSVNLWYFHKR